MIGLVAALLAGYGTFLLYTGLVCGWQGLGGGRGRSTRRRRRSLRSWLDQAGLVGVGGRELGGAAGLLAVLGAATAFALFGGILPALMAAGFAASFPVVGFRDRRRRRIATAQEAWPRLLEELRLLTGSVGRSIPQALFDVGRRAPDELRSGFAVAEREWLLSTDFERTITILKEQLGDPTADAVCETLVVAHEVGGGGLDRRLAELIEDRVAELHGRKDAISKQAGVRFARRFVLVVPLGMALAGLSIGTGRASYASPSGQAAVAAGLAAIVACWAWSGRLMRVPDEPRVFAGSPIGLPLRVERAPAEAAATAGPVAPTGSRPVDPVEEVPA